MPIWVAADVADVPIWHAFGLTSTVGHSDRAPPHILFFGQNFPAYVVFRRFNWWTRAITRSAPALSRIAWARRFPTF